MAGTQEALEGAGLTSIEARVYMELLERGPSTVGPIVKALGLHRATVYSVLQRMMEKGMVSYITKSGRRHFSASEPEGLMDILKEKEKGLESVMPQLKAKKMRAKEKHSAELYEGTKGMRSVFEGMLRMMKEGDEYLVINTSEQMPLENYIINWSRKRSRKGVNMKILFGEEIKRAEMISRMPHTQAKYLPKQYSSPAAMNVFRDITGIFLMAKKNPLTLLIRNKDIADGFRNYFELLWNQDVKVYKGFDDVTGRFSSMLDSLKRGEEYYVLGASTGVWKRELPKYFFNFHQRRVKKGVRVKMLYIPEIREHILNEMKNSGDPKMRTARIKELPPEFSSPMQINLCRGNQVLMFLFGKEMMCFEIESKVLHDNFKAYFDALWSQETMVYRGQDAIERIYTSVFKSMKPSDEMVIFAAKPATKRGAQFNLGLTRKFRPRMRRHRLIYYGMNKMNMDRAREFEDIGCETKIIPTDQRLPISTIVAGDNVMNTIWGREPLAFLMKNKTVADSLRSNFELLWDQETRVMKGLDAIQWVFEDMLKYGHADFIGARGYFMDLRPKYIDSWESRAKKCGFTMRNVVDIKARGHRVTGFPFAETKYNIPEEFSRLSVFWIYGNKVVISNWMQKEPIAIVIENKSLHGMYREQFESLWNQEMQVYKGLDGPRFVLGDITGTLKPGEEALFMGPVTKNYQTFLLKELKAYLKRIGKMGIKERVMPPKGSYVIGSRSTEVRYLPREMLSPVDFVIYGGKVALVNWTRPVSTVIMENSKVADSFRKYFQLLWKSAK